MAASLIPGAPISRAQQNSPSAPPPPANTSPVPGPGAVSGSSATSSQSQNAAQPGAPAQSGAQNPAQNATSTIRRVTQLVQLVAVVTDHRHKFITDLDVSDFRVLDDGHQQKISFFSRQTDLPLRIALLLDTSNSIRDRLQFEQDASIDFLTDVLRRHKDMGFIMTFDNEPQVVQDYSEDIDILARSIEKQRAGGGTALNDAIYKASQHLMQAPPAPGKDPEVRRVLVIFSDGDDNLSDHSLDDALNMAQRAGIAIYAISTNTNWVALDGETVRKLHESQGEKILRQFADQTGGRIFFPYSTNDLAESFQDIGAELRSQYLIAFLPDSLVPNGRFHALKVETERKGLTVRTRRGYFAPTTSGESEISTVPSQ
jgi:Ca-activated chloride channel family protein